MNARSEHKINWIGKTFCDFNYSNYTANSEKVPNIMQVFLFNDLLIMQQSPDDHDVMYVDWPFVMHNTTVSSLLLPSD
jgi:hypothetical protein